MATYTNVASMNQGQAKLFANARRSVTFKFDQLEPGLRAKADELTSGTMTQGELDAMGNPHGRGNGRRARGKFHMAPGGVMVPKLPINEQKGRLKRSLRIITVRTKDGVTKRLQYIAPYSKFVLRPGGTRLMKDRGFWVALSAHLEKERQKLLRTLPGSAGGTI